jgi:hypothetical protein
MSSIEVYQPLNNEKGNAEANCRKQTKQNFILKIVNPIFEVNYNSRLTSYQN